MKHLLSCWVFLFIFGIAYPQVNPNYHDVKGYTRRDGTVVKPYKRTNPNSTNRDNYSTYGNTNPWTDKPGWIKPDNKPLPNYSTTPSYNYTPKYNYKRSNSSSNSTNTYRYNSNYSYISGEKTISYNNGKEVFNVLGTSKTNFKSNLTYFSYNPYGHEIVETKGGAAGQLLHGTYKFYSKEGILLRGENYDYGLRHGEVKVYDDYGDLQEQQKYAFGALTYAKFKDDAGNTIELIGELFAKGSIEKVYSGEKLIKKVVYNSEKAREITFFDRETGVKQLIIHSYGDTPHGPFEDYYADGITIERTGNFYMGKKEGVFREYFESGQLSSTTRYKNDKKEGAFELYHNNGNLKETGYYKNDLLNGQFKFYDEDENLVESRYFENDELNGEAFAYRDGKVIIKGFFKNGEKQGKWEDYYLDHESHYPVQYYHYNQGNLHGAFRIVRQDSVIEGTYLQGELHGEYKVYRPLLTILTGKPSNLDFTDNLVINGEYLNGGKTGKWTYFDITGSIIEEGRFWNNLKQGEWRYYYRKFVNKEGSPLTYSKKLFLVENYLKGKKNGKAIRYSFLEKQQVMCDTSIGTVNPLDTCFKHKYIKVNQLAYFKNGQLHGPFELKDSLNRIVRKGEFRYGKKEGEWVEVERNDSSEYVYEYSFTNDLLDGSFVKKQNDAVIQRGMYANDKASGIWYDYFQGQITKKTVFESDRRITQHYSLNGVIELEEIHQSNTLYSITLFDKNGRPGRKYEDFYFQKDAKNAFTEINFIKDTIYQTQYYLKNEIDPAINAHIFLFTLRYAIKNNTLISNGPFAISLKSGEMLMQGTYKEGHFDGELTGHYNNQELIQIEHYKDGVFISEDFKEMTTLDPYSGEVVLTSSNNTFEIVKIKNGKRHGFTKIIDHNGDTTKKTKYKKGIPVN